MIPSRVRFRHGVVALAAALAIATTPLAAAPLAIGTGVGAASGTPLLHQIQRKSLSQVQQNALVDGCKLRYEGNSKKHKRCLNQDANWQDALAQGCTHRYSGNTKKLRECMNY